MSAEVYRILSPEGQLEKGRKAPSIGSDALVRMYSLMVRNRLVDDRMIKMQRQGRIGFYIGSTGEEASIIPSAMALEEKDWIVPCYRELGAAMVRGYTLGQFCNQLFGNREDAVKGRQMPNHYAFPEKRFTSISSPVGTQIPQATGLAVGLKIRKEDAVALVYFGDGATSQGDFHIGMNFAGVFKAPIIFLCRNNQWAISVPSESQTASESFAIKATAYGLEGIRVDGNDALAVYEATRRARARAARGQGATLIEAVTYRQGAHSTSDDPRAYRKEGEVEEWERKDPLRRLKAYLVKKKLWDDGRQARLEEETNEELQAALKRAEEIGPPPLESIIEDVYDQPSWNLLEQLQEIS